MDQASTSSSTAAWNAQNGNVIWIAPRDELATKEKLA